MKNKIGTKEKPMLLKTPPLTSEYTMHVDEKDAKEVLVCTVGKTVLLYNIDCLNDLHEMLKKHGDWMELGSADEQNLPETELSRLGAVRKKILLAVGMDLKKGFVEDLECIYRHLWKHLGLQR